MAFFSKPRGRNAQTQTLAQDILTPAVVTMASDGDMTKEELLAITQVCRVSPIFTGLDTAQIDAFILETLATCRADGAYETVTAVSARLSPGLRETAMCFAVQVASSDGTINDSEKDVLVGMARQLNIDLETFAKIVQVIPMLQRSADR